MVQRVSSVSFTPSAPQLQAQGLLGWMRCTIDGDLAVDGIGLRRTWSGELTFSWPGHTAGTGRFHHHVRPADDAARRTLEAELLAHLFPLIGEGAA